MTRRAEVPIGRIRASGYGLDRAAARVHWYVLYEGAQTVFVDDLGAVFAAPAGCPLERKLTTSRLNWCVGRFESGHDRGSQRPMTRALIVENLRERAIELRMVAA